MSDGTHQLVSIRVFDCYLAQVTHFTATSWREQVIIIWDDDACMFCTRPTCLVGFFQSKLTEKQQSTCRLLHLDTLYWLWANQSLRLLLNTACFIEKQQIQLL